MDWTEALAHGQQLTWDEKPLPGRGRALALSPHPDDPEAIAVTLRCLAQGGWELHWAILTGAWSGVLDDFVGPSRERKVQAREAEQREAARLFGLPDQQLVFLRLPETDRGDLEDCEETHGRLFAYLNDLSPELVLLPTRQDTNPSHRLAYRYLAEWVPTAGHRVMALGNEDPKTTDFRADFQVRFGAESAAWKAALLECHRSQSARNQATRNMTFADRILVVNRACPGLPEGLYAERFQVECWRWD